MSAEAIACEMLRKSETLRLVAYADAGYGWARPTIGYGATGPGIVKGTRWTREQAETDLAARVAVLVGRVRELVTLDLPDGAISALVSFAYNTGCPDPCEKPPPGARECGVCRLRGSTILRRINAGELVRAADAFPLWNKSNGKVLAALVKRRDDERRAYLAALRAS